MPAPKPVLASAAARPPVVIVSSVRLFREGLAELVGRAPLGAPALVAQDLADARARAAPLERAVVLLDASDAGAADTARALARLPVVAAVVAFASGDDVAERVELAEAGVTGYLSRDGSLAELLAVVEAAGRGELACSPQLAGALARRLARVAVAGPAADAPAERLTYRERDLVRLVDEGKSNKEIARALHIEVATVKNHIHHILRKLGVRRRGEAAAALRWHQTTAAARE
jgi:DNA-binding NarL/FixJ family response regulator